ncbi:MAG: hypothetical protein H6713_34205 [Myxococcales bacterium]|nr:hypothetical protein [Myxococcales bacterium]
MTMTTTRARAAAPGGAILISLLLSTLFFTLLFTLAFTLAFSTGCGELEERVVTSPLVGATRVDERGEARVDELLRARGYTYLRLASSADGEWHVITGAAPERGATVRYRGYAELRDYRSPTLDRQFDRLVFASARAIQAPQ